MRFKPVHVDPGLTVDMNDTGDDGSVGLGVSRWFGWLDGTVYKDLNNNGQYDEGVDAPIPNTDMDQRWRDGSIKEGTFTNANGRYEYPTAEGGALGRWIINEQGFARFSADPGASVHDERTGDVTPSCLVDGTPVDPCIPNSQGGGLLMNQSLLEGHRATVDWGKRDYPGTPGQIVGITYFATTRNEFDARFQAHEDYEAAIPDVTVYLETPGPRWGPQHRRRHRGEQVHHRPLAAAECEPGSGQDHARLPRAPIRSPRAATRSWTSTGRHHEPVQSRHRTELPRGSAGGPAHQGRRVRRWIRLR